MAKKRHLHDILIEKVEDLRMMFDEFAEEYEDELDTEDNKEAIEEVQEGLEGLEQGLIHIDL